MNKSEERKKAALYCALLNCRGAITGLLEGDCELDRVHRILEATTPESISESIGVSIDDIAVDWHNLLSRTEEESIMGITLRSEQGSAHQSATHSGSKSE